MLQKLYYKLPYHHREKAMDHFNQNIVKLCVYLELFQVFYFI